MGRVMLSAEEIQVMKGENYMAKSKEGVKEGSPVDDMLNIKDSDSIMAKYLTRKIAEYDLAMENFEEDLEEKLEKARRRKYGEIEEDGEEETIIAGVGSYSTDNDIEPDEEQSNGKIVEVNFKKQQQINPNNIIDDLL